MTRIQTSIITIDMKTLNVSGTSEAVAVKFNKVCALCENTGIVLVANGEDDFDHDFCDCKRGTEVYLEAARLNTHND